VTAMIERIGVPIGAGVASALLFIVTIKGTLIALALVYFAPLPMMIAALGWGALGGAISVGVACALVVVVAAPLSALQFAAILALPAWALAAFAASSAAGLRWRKRAESAPEWTSPGAMVTFAIAIGALLGLTALVAPMLVGGGYEAGVEAFARMIEPGFEDVAGAGAMLPDDLSPHELALILVRLAPAAIAGSLPMMLCVNLYAAARSAALSHRLRRPWSDLPSTLRLHPALAVVAIVALGLAFALPAPSDQFAWVAVGALSVAFLFQGLATVHALSRGLPMRLLLLAALYACCALRSNWTLPALAIIGLVDSLFSLRARVAARRPRF